MPPPRRVVGVWTLGADRPRRSRVPRSRPNYLSWRDTRPAVRRGDAAIETAESTAESPTWVLSSQYVVGRVGLAPATNGFTPHRSRWLPIDPVIICPAIDYVAGSRARRVALLREFLQEPIKERRMIER